MDVINTDILFLDRYKYLLILDEFAICMTLKEFKMLAILEIAIVIPMYLLFTYNFTTY